MVVPNDTPLPFTYKFSAVKPVTMPGGSVKVVDSSTFKISQQISAVEVVVEVGAMRFVSNLSSDMIV